MNVQVSSSWLFWIMLQLMWIWRYLFELMFSILLNIPRSWILDHMVFNLWATSILFSISTNRVQELQFLHIYQCFSFFSPYRSYLLWVWGNISLLICISLMINGDEHPFLYLLAICLLLWTEVYLPPGFLCWSSIL